MVRTNTMIQQTRRCKSRFVLLVLAASAVGPLGCVRRTLTIQTEPAGALIFLNDEEIGRSPVSTDFTWYGDYELIARHDGYETLDTHFAVPKPWYQWPLIDFFSEVLWSGKIHDEHFFEFTLQPSELPIRADLTQRALDLRRQALGGVDARAFDADAAGPSQVETIDSTSTLEETPAEQPPANDSNAGN